MHVTVVNVRVKDHCIGAFIEATRPNHEGAIEEFGNVRFDVIQSQSDPTQFILYEVYESEASAKAHKETPHYLAWREEVSEMMAEPREGISYRDIFVPHEEGLLS